MTFTRFLPKNKPGVASMNCQPCERLKGTYAERDVLEFNQICSEMEDRKFLPVRRLP